MAEYSHTGTEICARLDTERRVSTQSSHLIIRNTWGKRVTQKQTFKSNGLFFIKNGLGN